MFIIELTYASIFSILIIMFITIKYLRKKYNIVPYPREYQHVNALHKRVEFILGLVAIISLVLFYIFEYSFFIIVCLILMIFLAFSFRFYMQYKHEREEKEYLITLVETLGIFIILVGVTALYLMV